MALWLIYGCWGIATITVNASVLKEALRGFTFYPVLWGGVIGLLCLVSFAVAGAGFLVRLDDYRKRVALKRIEAWTVALFLGFLIVYPVVMWANALNPHFTPDEPARFDLAILSLSYLVFPFWRVKNLLDRTKQLRLMRKVQKSDAGGNS